MDLRTLADTAGLTSFIPYKISLLPDPSSPGFALIVGLPSILQVYDLWRDESVADIVVNTKNIMLTFPGHKKKAKTTNSYVSLACLGLATRDMATIDIQEGAFLEVRHCSKE